MSDSEGDADAVRAANRAFYEAFERRDLDAMSVVWDHGENVVCTHPGWASLRGWAKVASSWFVLFQNEQRLQFILTNEHVDVRGDTAWVTIDENIIDGDRGVTVAALNVFAREATNGWRMVVHHGSAVGPTVATEG